ncbi:MAG: DUF4350 domain-containing protein [Bacteroidota bacterium]
MKKSYPYGIVLLTLFSVGIIYAQIDTVHFRMPDSLGKRGVTYSYPIYCDDVLTTTDSIISGEFTVAVNNVFTVTGVDTAGTMLGGTQSILYNNVSKKIIFANAQPITGKGVLIYLKVLVNASAAANVTEVVSLSGAMLNEGAPSVIIDNGSFRPMDIFINPKNPPQNKIVGDTIFFSATGDMTPPLVWTVGDTSVASIDATGRLVGKKVGQTIAKVTDSFGLWDQSNTFQINSASLNGLTLSIPDTSIMQNLTFDLPIRISDVTSLGIISAQWKLNFNANTLVPKGVLTTGTIAQSWGIPTVNFGTGTIDVAMAGSDTLTGKGVLAYVRFQVKRFAVVSSNLTLQNVLFNETIGATIDNGIFNPIGGPIININPNVLVLTRGDTITYSAVGGTAPFKWYSSDTSRVIVDSLTGKVKAKSRGSITLSAYDAQGFDGSISITVNDFMALLPDTIVRVGDSVDVTLSVSNVTGLGILSTQIKIGYDTTKIRFGGLNTAGTLSSGMQSAVNDSAAVIRMAFSGTTSLAGVGTFAVLRFYHKAPSGQGQFSPLTFLEFQCNEPGPLQPTATIKNGKITIAPPLNQFPLLAKALNDTTISEDQQLTFDYDAVDGDNDQLKFALQNPSIGMTLDTVSGVFNWKPGFSQSGVHSFIVSVSDGKGGSASKQTNINVNNTNRLPLFTRFLNDTSIQEQQSLVFDIDAFDPDGNSVRFDLQGQTAGMQIDSITGLFSWTPTLNQANVFNFTVRVFDQQGGFADDPVAITVTNNNQLPLFTSVMGDTSINENQQLTFDYNAVDPDNDLLKFFMVNAPLGMTLDSISGVMNWKPAFNQSGNVSITTGVRDANNGATTKITNITINNVNRPPVFTQVLPETTFTEPGLTTNFTFTGQDPDNENLTFTNAESPTGAVISAAGQFSWTPTTAQVGTHRLVVKMGDANIGVFDTAYFVVEIKNTSPVFTATLNDTIISEAQALSFTYKASDVQNDTLFYSLGSQGPAGLAISQSGQLNWTPDFTQSGIYTIVVKLQEHQFILLDTAKITVLNTNRLPQFVAKLPDLQTFVDSLVNFKYSATDPDNENLTFAFVKSPSNATLQSDGTFSWKPEATHLGKDTIVVNVNDGTSSVPDTAVLTVNGFPFAEVTQTVFDFGSITFGGTKTMRSIIKNNGVVPLSFRALPQSNPISDLNFILDTVGVSTILPGKQDTVSITYSPKTVGGHSAGYIFTTNDFRKPSYVFTANGSAIAKLVVTKRLLVDVQHNSAAPLTDSVKGLGLLFAFLSKSGIQVTFSAPVLQPHGNDILLLVTPQKNFSKPEIDSISSFVKNGGLLIALGNSVQEGNNDALNSLLKDSLWSTSLSLNNDVVVDSTANMLSPLAPLLTTFADTKHPYFANVDTLVFFSSSSVNVSDGAIPFVTTSGKGKTIGTPSIVQPTVIGLNKIGKGKIVLMGDADAWRVDSKSDSVPPNIAIKDNLAFVLNVLSITEDYEVKMPAKTPNERYQLVSIPFDLENSDIKSVLKSLGEPNPLIWRLFGRYDPAAAKYAEFPSDKFNSFRRGEAYWLITRGQFDLTPGNATIVPVQNFFPIKIGPGYSIIGNPFPFKVSWKHSTHDSVQNVIWGFDGTSFKAESLALDKFTGYFVKNLTKDSLTIYINPQDITDIPSPTPNLGKNATIASYLKEGEWRIGISAQSGKSSDLDNYAGVASGAKEEFDNFDISEPPPTPTDYVIVRFPNKHWKQQPGSYAMDIRETNEEGLYWDFEVISSRVQSNVELALTEFGNLPNSFSLYLIDKATEKAVLLSNTYQYQFTMMKNETRRNFRLVAGKTEFIEKNTQGIPLIALDYALLQNYPNPFNPSTLIRYVLGHSGHVTLELYNMLGQRVRTLKSEFQTIGTYNIEWDGKDEVGTTVATGVYFYKVSVVSNNEKVFTETKKMVLIK